MEERGSVIVVTGGSSGIGFATAKFFGENGAAYVAALDRNEPETPHIAPLHFH
jgi:NAD(P)-dependent dehydrogenase (short-subunit alcohol dehydrogenase family)